MHAYPYDATHQDDRVGGVRALIKNDAKKIFVTANCWDVLKCTKVQILKPNAARVQLNFHF